MTYMWFNLLWSIHLYFVKILILTFELDLSFVLIKDIFLTIFTFTMIYMWIWPVTTYTVNLTYYFYEEEILLVWTLPVITRFFVSDSSFYKWNEYSCNILLLIINLITSFGGVACCHPPVIIGVCPWHIRILVGLWRGDQVRRWPLTWWSPPSRAPQFHNSCDSFLCHLQYMNNKWVGWSRPHGYSWTHRLINSVWGAPLGLGWPQSVGPTLPEGLNKPTHLMRSHYSYHNIDLFFVPVLLSSTIYEFMLDLAQKRVTHNRGHSQKVPTKGVTHKRVIHKRVPILSSSEL
jgi:hypothetical protein